ncbi:DUF916 domain-containing protein [archaeon]|nr:DUF916 domain-containing protein [archaeon]
MLKRCLFFGIIFILISNSVYAIGITPSRTLTYYVPDTTEEFSIFVINPTGEVMYANICFGDEFETYTDFENKNITLEPNEKKEIPFSFRMPDEMHVPGDHTTTITISELPKPVTSEGHFISALTAVVGHFVLRVPYDGAFLNAGMKVESVSVGQKVKFDFFWENLGNIALSDIDVVIEIFDSSGKNVGKIDYTESLNLYEIKEDTRYWDSNGMAGGEYTAKMSVRYSSKLLETETVFKLGDVFIEILDFQKELITGEINEYVSIIESGWNEVIEGVYINLMIGVEGDSYDFKSTNFDLGAWEKKEVKMYIALDKAISKLSPGDYNATLSVFYDGVSNSEDFVISIKNKINYLIVIGIGAIVVAIIIFSLYKFKNLKRRKKIGGKK